MANLNLSEFTEKLFVTDADHTFIWDTANAISKRVSRNSWLNSGTLTSDAPVTISQTWGTTGIYTAFKVVANETATAATASNLLELWSGNAAALKLSIRKSGQIVGPSGTIAAPTYGFADTDWGTGFSGWYRLGTGVACSTAGGTISAFSITHTSIRIGASIPFGWTSGTAENALDTILLRDSASGNTLALRNGAAAQTFRVYGAYPDTGINYARLALSCDTSGNATISTQALGTYTAGTVSINGVPVGLGKGNVSSNVAIGTGVLNANTTGAANTAIGSDAMKVNTTGFINTVVGVESFFSSVAACNFNNVFGAVSLKWLTTGSGNVAVGYNAATILPSTANVTNSSNSVFVGNQTKPEANGQTNQNVFGYDATGIGSNSVVLGNDSITKTALKGNVGIGTTSPSSKLQVTGGDVEIETVTSGIIMKAAGTSTRYRITLNAGGTALVFTAI